MVDLVEFAFGDNGDATGFTGETIKAFADAFERFVGVLLDDIETCADIDPFGSRDGGGLKTIDALFDLVQSFFDQGKALF